jgi:hypothetical protein
MAHHVLIKWVFEQYYLVVELLKFLDSWKLSERIFAFTSDEVDVLLFFLDATDILIEGNLFGWALSSVEAKETCKLVTV